MADLEPRQASFCQRICCCMTATTKEPPVQLIRSGALQTSTTPMTTNGHISVADQTIDKLDDVNHTDHRLRVAVGDGVDPSQAPVHEKRPHDYAMNDMMMDEILGGNEDKHDEHGKAIVEDVISISTDVIEEVDEVELSRLRLNSTSLHPAESPTHAEDQKSLEEAAESQSDDEEIEVIVEEVTISLAEPSTSKGEEESTESEEEEDDEDASEEEEQSEKSSESVETAVHEDASQSENVLEKERQGTIGPSVIQVGRYSDTDDDVIIEAFDPPSLPPKSIMYADTSSEEDSDDDDEADQEVMPPVQRSQRIMNIDQLRTDPMPNDDAESGSSTMDGAGTNPFDSSSSSSDDDLSRKLADRKTSDDEGVVVTRIVVRNDGRPDVLSSGEVKLNLDGREAITDEEFSEKLI
ncbi:unnamed protein product [Nippostrongylus brasiliensis]|uniref:PACT_coil_coil domain-containing protein n=1 Tax=Nippostrongylus brasiliensis TaxID=27835 RepID=A0A0N4YAY1_NIPBR|nr:unnamed protein product [Nippostrongylus brasiliensis]